MSQIVEHAHCEVCQRVVDPGRRVCSDECQAKLDEAQKTKKKTALLIVLMAVFVLLLPNLGRLI